MSKCIARLCTAMGMKTSPAELMPDFYKGESAPRAGLMGFSDFVAAVQKG